MKVPAVSVATDENQLLNVGEFKNKGLIRCAGWWSDKGIYRAISACIEELSCARKRRAIAEKCSIIDGRGGKRIVEYLLEKIR